jgi:uncharacterized protein
MILKLLLVVGVLVAVYFIFFKAKPLQAKSKSSAKKQEPKANDMIECSQCHVYVALEECILSNGEYYCSKECIEESR